jgi:pilus assembly protein CpaB
MTLALVATKEIRAGAKILPSMFKLESRDVSDSDPATVKDLDEVVDQYARVDIAQNTPLIRSALTTAISDSRDIGERIPTGYRAVAIPINALTGVEGWVRPGAHVDVVWSTEREKQFVVATIVENAKVLSVERSLESEQPSSVITANPPSHITLVVSSADAQKIQLAKSAGTLSLSLRGVDDRIASENGPLTSDNLLLRRSARDEVKGKVVLDGTEYGFARGRLVKMSELEKASVNN